MPKRPEALLALPPAVVAALRTLGDNLAVARVRRRESQRAWAKRLGVSVPTLIRMERGDAGVGAGIYATALWLMGRINALAGIYATALWLMGRINALPELAAPASDRGALEREVRTANKRRAVRSAASAEARLGRKQVRK